MTNNEYCTLLLSRAVPRLDSCLVPCREDCGPIDDKGYMRITVNKKQWLIHRFVALYHVPRTEEQIINLMRFRVNRLVICHIEVCINPDHTEFSMSKPEKIWAKSDNIYEPNPSYRY